MDPLEALGHLPLVLKEVGYARGSVVRRPRADHARDPDAARGGVPRCVAARPHRAGSIRSCSTPGHISCIARSTSVSRGTSGFANHQPARPLRLVFST